MCEKSAGAVVKKTLKKTMSVSSPSRSENCIGGAPLLPCAIWRYELRPSSHDLAGSGASMLFFPEPVPNGGVYQGTVARDISLRQEILKVALNRFGGSMGRNKRHRGRARHPHS